MPDYLMKRGTKGTIVTNLQTYLMSLGYKLPKYGADGDYGAETEAAVKAFQKDYSLPVTGVWGEAEQKAAETPKPVEPPAEDLVIFKKADWDAYLEAVEKLLSKVI